MDQPTNSVPIDEHQVQRELDELAGGPATGPTIDTEPSGYAPAGPPAPAPPPPMDWTLMAGAIVLVLDKVVAPNWHLQGEEKDLLLEQTKVTFAVFFPNANVDPRVQAVLALGGTIAIIASRRFDPETKKLAPLRLKPPAPEGTDAAGEDRAPH